MNQQDATSPRESVGSLRVALVGDLHTYRLAVGPWRLLGKRLVGQANVWFSRRHRFDRKLLPGLFERVAAIEPDVLLLSGDLTSTALPREFADMAAMLTPLTRTIRTFIVPGNHDRYTYSSSWRKAFRRRLGAVLAHRWPHAEKLSERWHVLALDTAVPRLLDSRGKVTQRQLEGARQAVGAVQPGEGLIVLSHYPVVMPPQNQPHWRHRLGGAADLLAALGECRGRVIYAHGHIHEPWLFRPEGQSTLTDINAGAPCQVNDRYPLGQGFWEIALPASPASPAAFRHHCLTELSPDRWEVCEHADPGLPSGS